jgi:DNA-binding NarL/FixJ family response regulator
VVDISKALSYGARGYVLKSSLPSELIVAIRKASEGYRVVSPEIERMLEADIASSKLTTRELEVLQLLRRGLSNPDIGSHLGITARTAKAHVSAILEKMEAVDRTEAVAKGFEQGLLKP